MSIETTPEITAQRGLVVDRRTGSTKWTINEFNRGASIMLIADTAGTQFHAHFDREQWAEFQAMVAGS